MLSELTSNGRAVLAPIFVLMTFGEGLYLWRNFRGLTQEELAAKADVSNDTISKHERKPGDATPPTQPSPKTRARLAKALSITPEDFYRSPTEMPPPDLSFSLEGWKEQVKSAYASGVFTKEELERELLEFLLEIKRGESD